MRSPVKAFTAVPDEDGHFAAVNNDRFGGTKQEAQMRSLTITGVAALSLLAVGLTITGPALAAAPGGAYASRAQSLLVADGDGSGADVRSNSRMVAMAVDGTAAYAGRAQSLLVADADGAGADVRVNSRWVA